MLRPVTVVDVASPTFTDVHEFPANVRYSTSYRTIGELLAAAASHATVAVASAAVATTFAGTLGTSASEIANDVVPLTLLGRSVLLARSVSRPAVPGTLACVVAVNT